MTTYAVNIRVKDCDVYIGRAGHGHDGYFGNPIRTNRRCQECGRTHTTPGSTIPCFTLYFYKRLKTDSEFKRRVEQLRGKRLGCFCKPNACHGDTIADYLEKTHER